MGRSANAPTVSTNGIPNEGEVLAGKYRVEATLGAGGMGVVLAARHLTLDERFAVKILLPEHAQNSEVVERFLREGRAAIKVRSEHVVRVVDVDRLPNRLPYIVMEYLDGWDLERLVRERGVLDPTFAVDLILQACEALAEAHALGTVHRDLKPANLFLTERVDGSACVKVLDFGISKVGRRESPITTTQSVMGSPEYMAPEQLRSTRDVDARADIWSIGAILFELLSGQPPFGGETLPEVCATVLKDEATPLRNLRPEIPEGLAAVVMRCLEKDANVRYSNCAELANALAPFGSDNARISADRIARVLHAAPALEREDYTPLALDRRREFAHSPAIIVGALALVGATVASVFYVRKHVSPPVVYPAPAAQVSTAAPPSAPPTDIPAPPPPIDSASANAAATPTPSASPTPSSTPTPTQTPTPTPSPTPIATPTPTPTPSATTTPAPPPKPAARPVSRPHYTPPRPPPAPRPTATEPEPLPLPPPPATDLFEERK